MFDIARAAILHSGVSEDRLPRTHTGVVEAFRNHIVQPGHVDQKLGAELSRVEALRIKADYTGTEIGLLEANEVVQKAELFVKEIERAFGLENSLADEDFQRANAQNDDGKVSEPASTYLKIETNKLELKPISVEDIRRQARENWLRLRREQVGEPHERDLRRSSDHHTSQGFQNSLDENFEE